MPTAPSAHPRERLSQLRTIKAVYEKMTTEKPSLPTPSSALPTLLATRAIQQSVSDMKKNIATVQSQLETAERQVASEESRLTDAKLLTSSLQTRTMGLQTVQSEKLSQSSSEKAKELIRAKQKRQQTFQRETEKLQGALDDFIENHLAAMLAAEELGGPVVGELTDVNEDMLTAGFSSQGKPKASKPSGSSASEGKRQRRIDEIWGTADEARSEKDAAAEEVRELLERLVTLGNYIELERDSAASRFLVRAKVAQFHPKDARKLRLIDFGRDLDD
jgi:predicted  nucleic acid-binding Zn-ribbon protein